MPASRKANKHLYAFRELISQMSGGDVFVGVLAFQGSFQPHLDTLTRMGVKNMMVKSVADLASCSHLIIPGGESTVMSHFLQASHLHEAIVTRFQQGDLALFGTCAGAILIGQEPSNEPAVGRQPVRFNLAPVIVRRNAYGRQIDSFQTTVRGVGPLEGDIDAMFIRAPKLEPLSSDVEVLALDGAEPVLLRFKRALLCSFHPELSGETIHRFFLKR